MTLKSTIAIVLISTISFGLSAQVKKGGAKKPLPSQASSQAKSKVVSVMPAASGNLKNDADSLSYSIGVNIGQSLKSQGMENLDLEVLKAAMNDVMKGNTLKISAENCMPVIMASMNKAKAKKFGPVKAEGEKFLAENKKKADVITLPSGLQYTILKKGEGELPKAEDKVKVHYHGTLINGQIFDSSVDRGTPATFGVTQVITGWVEALQLMPVGSKWKLFIPAALAYGERGAGENIPPFSTLIFDVELLGIEKTPEAGENK
jgi:FKBP-type peptidyl-prolyl cis-trans isomerase FklB